jgi:peptide/nickel transport system substrate-binding protein
VNFKQPHGRLAVLAATAIAVSLTLAACSGTSSTSSTTAKSTSVTAALSAEPSSLDPIFDTSLPADNIFYEVFDGLTKINSKGAVVPNLATTFTPDAALTTWTFNLRHNAYFSDGTNVTAADVAFTFNTAQTAKGSALAAFTTNVKTVTATSKYVATFTLTTPYAALPNLTTIPIIPEKAYKKLGKTAFSQKPVGSGAYTVVKWNKGTSIVLKRNAKYWGTKGSYENVTYDFVADSTALANSLQSGSLDIGLLDPAQIPTLRKSSAVNVVTTPSNRVLYLGMNQKLNTWMANADIRKAISLAVDRTALSTKLLSGTVKPTNQLIAPSVNGYDTSMAAPVYNVSQAKSLIKASGYDGSVITLSYPTTGLPQVVQLAQAVSSYLTAAGLNIKLDGQEAATYLGNWFGNKLPGVYVEAFAPSTMDADLPYLLLAKSGNEGSFSDAAIDKLMVAEVGAFPASKRTADFAKIADLIAKNSYYAPLFTDSYTYGVAKSVTWTPRPDGFITF